VVSLSNTLDVILHYLVGLSNTLYVILHY
jgi:hypothetical protein